MNRSTLARHALLGAVFLFSACDCSSEVAGGPCETRDDCIDDQVCIDGTCQDFMPVDAGMRDSSAADGNTETCFDMDGDGAQGMTEECPSGTDCDDTRSDVAPGADELCGDGRDNDCNGETDEDGCICGENDNVSCYTGDAATRDVGICRSGVATCGEGGVVGECRLEVLPLEEETCDGTDEDCDGLVDEGLRNACGECSDVEPMELCDDGIDNDCDGMTDEDCVCDFQCGCAPMTSCECNPPTNQPCYEGPFDTNGRGLCHGGVRDCQPDNSWGTCTGQVIPTDDCAGGVADGQDNDCDGQTDEGCGDADMDGVPAPMDCDDTNPDINPAAVEVCDGIDNDCNGVPDDFVTNACGGCGEVPATDECGNGLDDDCDGEVDDGCACGDDGDTQGCYGGPEGTAGVGQCLGGTQTCVGGEFSRWGECVGQVVPSVETCDGAVDEDCDGEVDERWAVGSNRCGWCDSTELCDEIDNDCDGLIDEGLRNRCGQCEAEATEVACDGMDDDCDGKIDEGLVNACGTCPPEPCFDEDFDTPSDCEREGRDCGDGIIEDMDNPGSVTLDATTIDFDYMYVAVNSHDRVAQVDTSGGPNDGNVNWTMPTYGDDPSRTAVATDGSVWVANRGSGSVNNEQYSNVIHLSAADGSVICQAPAPGRARGLAIDGNGDVWVGTWEGTSVWHYSGTATDGTTFAGLGAPAGGFPRCQLLGGPYNTSHNIYGLAADPDGYIWTSSTPNTVRIAWADASMTNFTNPARYGVAVGADGRTWLGDWTDTSQGIHSIDHVTGAVRNVTDPNGRTVTAVTVHPDGTVWGTRHNHAGPTGIVAVDPETMAVICNGETWTTPGSNPHGAAVDRSGRVWAVNRNGGYLSVFRGVPLAGDPTSRCDRVAAYDVVDDAIAPGGTLYSYSDMTGHLLRTFIAPQGIWTQDFDSGYANAYWTELRFSFDAPAGTSVTVTIVVADDATGLETAVVCDNGGMGFDTSPIDLAASCALPRGRFLRVLVELQRDIDSPNRPRFDGAEASWAY